MKRLEKIKSRILVMVLTFCMLIGMVPQSLAAGGETNLAKGKKATASSVYASSLSASKAVDGKYVQDDSENFWSTANYKDKGSWWQVDLGEKYQISDVKIQFRGIPLSKTDKRYVLHFAPATITFQVSDDGKEWKTVVDKSENTPDNDNFYSLSLYSYTLDAPGRYVRLLFENGSSDTSIKGNQIVQLAEVEVYGGKTSGGSQESSSVTSENAVRKYSASSFTVEGFEADKAMDGLYNSDKHDNCWSSGNDKDVGAWWQVDMGIKSFISDVRIQFRGIPYDATRSLYHFTPKSITFQVSDDGKTWTTAISKNTDVPKYDTWFSPELNTYTVKAAGRYLRLLFEDGSDDTTIKGHKYIQLTEIELNAVEAIPPVLTTGSADRFVQTKADVSFVSTEAGRYYYAVVEDGAAVPALDTSGTGLDCMQGTTILNLTELSEGAKDLYIRAKDAAENLSDILKVDIPVYTVKVFSDLKDYGWAREAIEALVSEGVIRGTSDTTYSPAAKITRGDFMSLLIRALKLEADVDSNFDDVKTSDYYYKAVGTAKRLGITDGMEGNRFNPGAYITREDMMVMTVRAMKAAGVAQDEADLSVLARYTDAASISSYAQTSIATLIAGGIISGDDNLIAPKRGMTRAETAMVIYKVFGKLEG